MRRLAGKSSKRPDGLYTLGFATHFLPVLVVLPPSYAWCLGESVAAYSLVRGG